MWLATSIAACGGDVSLRPTPLVPAEVGDHGPRRMVLVIDAGVPYEATVGLPDGRCVVRHLRPFIEQGVASMLAGVAAPLDVAFGEAPPGYDLYVVPTVELSARQAEPRWGDASADQPAASRGSDRSGSCDAHAAIAVRDRAGGELARVERRASGALDERRRCDQAFGQAGPCFGALRRALGDAVQAALREADRRIAAGGGAP
ncbi:MAG TPA: hypothetical protein VFP50_07805 [Anaeromyxobacteraceae bacterium]|nr:hypothetical protein [Anaeromyxobacteraceae bacterium]